MGQQHSSPAGTVIAKSEGLDALDPETCMIHDQWRERACAALAAMALACGGAAAGASTQSSKPFGLLVASVRLTARSGGPTVTRVQIEVGPAGVFQARALDSLTGDYVGTATVPTGPQTITASAYAYATLVGTGSATVNVSSRGTTSITIKILDNSTSPPAQDHGPIVIAVSASNSSPGVNEVIDLSVLATEADGDPISYQWADDCHGNFGSPTSSSRRKSTSISSRRSSSS